MPYHARPGYESASNRTRRARFVGPSEASFLVIRFCEIIRSRMDCVRTWHQIRNPDGLQEHEDAQPPGTLVGYQTRFLWRPLL